MKKSVLLIIVVFSSCFLSCKQKQSCVCEITVYGFPTRKTVVIDNTEENAKKECEKLSFSDSVTVSRCKIK